LRGRGSRPPGCASARGCFVLPNALDLRPIVSPEGPRHRAAAPWAGPAPEPIERPTGLALSGPD